MPSFQSLIISHTNFRKNPKTIMKSPSARISSNIVFSLRTDCMVKHRLEACSGWCGQRDSALADRPGTIQCPRWPRR
jgi:hypothetical protein